MIPLATSTFDYTLFDLSWLGALLVIAGGVVLGLAVYQLLRFAGSLLVRFLTRQAPRHD